MERVKSLLLSVLFLTCSIVGLPQIQSLKFDEPESFTVKGVNLSNGTTLDFPYGLPLFSVIIDGNFYNSYCSKPDYIKGGIHFQLADSIEGVCSRDDKFKPGLRYTVKFINRGKGTHAIENLVPLGEGTDKIYITASGSKNWPQYLCRTLLFRPGYGPVGVIMPDNAWHAGFADFRINDTVSVTGLARRTQRDQTKTETDRWAVTLKPDGWVEFSIYIDIHKGVWQNGLKMMFQERWLYDLSSFDNTLFQRKDLQWMRNEYLILLQFAWDKKYFDFKAQRYSFYQNFFEFDSLTGGYDVFILWPTWPRLGLDQRNQWDMYRDLPGGISELRHQADFLHQHRRKYFISYNPWDESTRKEDQLKGMQDLLREIDADGVVLDTRGESGKLLQATADRVKPGIIMYSEGMAVPKDMPGIVAGRVHDALVLPPPLNLNKIIKPGFAIFRVLQLADDRLHRELAISFFNGYGVEINTMRPGRPEWMKEEFAYMGLTTKILRENSSVFINDDWIPLIPVTADSVYVNLWKTKEKTVFTIFSLKPEGFIGNLFEIDVPRGKHMVDLWNHREIRSSPGGGKTFASVRLEGFDRSWLNTRREGNVGCIAILPELIKVKPENDSLFFTSGSGDSITITGQNPSYQVPHHTFPSKGMKIRMSDYFPPNVEKVVIQLFKNNELQDECIYHPVPNIPHLIYQFERTPVSDNLPQGMVKIPGGNFRFYTKRDPKATVPFIQLPDYSDTLCVTFRPFMMDEYPVTNRQFQEFLKRAAYTPKDSSNFLRNWVNALPPERKDDYPVVYVSLEDAKAYAKYFEKRLPTEIEWQYAAQGTDMRIFPWGNDFNSLKCNSYSDSLTSVFKFPLGASPFGVQDMIGNVWQMTGDVYDNGCYYFQIIRGGSFFKPESSNWYITGGPLPAYHPEMLLLISPGLDRNSTVGFRCVKDLP